MGIDAFDESYQVRGGQDYNETTKGGQLRFGKSLSPHVQVTTGMLVQDTKISGLPWYSNPEIRSQEGSSLTIANRSQIERNTLDNKFDPTRG
jgi:outer membrane protein assembly factor BamA